MKHSSPPADGGHSLQDVVAQAVGAVFDPELPGITIGSLGMVRHVLVTEDAAVSVVLVPTFLGCPALRAITSDVEAAARAAGAAEVTVRFDHQRPWTTQSIDAIARSGLRDLGIAVLDEHGLACPFCGANELDVVSKVGPASCRSAYWCPSCRNVVEVFRDSQNPTTTPVPLPTRRLSYAHL